MGKCAKNTPRVPSMMATIAGWSLMLWAQLTHLPPTLTPLCQLLFTPPLRLCRVEPGPVGGAQPSPLSAHAGRGRRHLLPGGGGLLLCPGVPGKRAVGCVQGLRFVGSAAVPQGACWTFLLGQSMRTVSSADVVRGGSPGLAEPWLTLLVAPPAAGGVLHQPLWHSLRVQVLGGLALFHFHLPSHRPLPTAHLPLRGPVAGRIL